MSHYKRASFARPLTEEMVKQFENIGAVGESISDRSFEVAAPVENWDAVLRIVRGTSPEDREAETITPSDVGSLDDVLGSPENGLMGQGLADDDEHQEEDPSRVEGSVGGSDGE